MRRVVWALLGLVLLSCAPRQEILSVPLKPQQGPPLASQLEPLLKTPSEVQLDVPFFSQAPNGDWNLPWQEACEEASAILAYRYAKGLPITQAEFKKELLSLFDWENKRFGDYKHTTIAQTADLIREYWNFDQIRMIEKPTVEQIKAELAQGNPVIAPFSGRDLKNPFYSNQGPYYHMLVIIGYDSEAFITNDVGTKRGKGYRYPFAHLMSALHDYDPVDMRKGAPRVIVVDADTKK